MTPTPLPPQLTVLSLGWGVQSWTLAAMAALGESAKPDYAIHADTTHERSKTYSFAAEWGPWLTAHGVPLVTVADPVTGLLHTSGVKNLLIPAYTLATKGAKIQSDYAMNDDDETVSTDTAFAGDLTSVEQTEGQLRRQCTNRWKIIPLRQFVSAELVRRGWAKTPGIVTMQLGISLDEFQRGRTSDVAYITHQYPLLDRKMTRQDCIAWLQRHNLPVPPKSACVFCPYHNGAAWAELKRDGGPDWDHAVAVDNLIRDARPPYPLFVHPKRVPLDQAIRIAEDAGYTQPDLFAVPEVADAACDNGGCFI